MDHVHEPDTEGARDWGAALRALLLLAFAAGVFALVWTGRIKLYIHPRFAPYTLMAAAMLAIMALVEAERFRAPARAGGGGDGWGRYAVFLAPLLLGLAIPPATFGADLAARQGVNLTARPATAPGPVPPPPDAAAEGAVALPAAAPAAAAPAPRAPATEPEIQVIPPTAGAPPDAAAAPAAGAAPAPPARYRQPPAPALVNGRIVLDEQNFAAWLVEIYDNPGKYAGKPLQMTGFVFRPEGLAPGEFVLARLIVTCHVAHAAPGGLLVAWPRGDELEADSWYRLEGVLEVSQYQGQDTVRVRAERLTPVERPGDPYIWG